MLKAVKPPYDPGYPRVLTEEEIARLLRPGLFERFSRETLLSGTLVAGLALMGCREKPPPPKEEPEAKAPVQEPDAELPKTEPEKNLQGKELEDARKRALQLAKELLAESAASGFWNEWTTIALTTVLDANPPVKYPRIPISYGNSYVGIFDTRKALEATKKLFEVYGIKLSANQTVKGEGYTFEADGWNPDRKIGFEIILPETEPADRKLQPSEMGPLGATVKAGKLRMFVVDASRFPNCDNDLYTPMEYYLASVIDYLNWIHGATEIDREKVLERVPRKK